MFFFFFLKYSKHNAITRHPSPEEAETRGTYRLAQRRALPLPTARPGVRLCLLRARAEIPLWFTCWLLMFLQIQAFLALCGLGSLMHCLVGNGRPKNGRPKKSRPVPCPCGMTGARAFYMYEAGGVAVISSQDQIQLKVNKLTSKSFGPSLCILEQNSK